MLKADRLTCSLVSQQVPPPPERDVDQDDNQDIDRNHISCIEAIGHETYVGVGTDILVYYRTKIVRR